MKDTVRGFFEYREKDEGWNDSFTVVDDDGMPFALQKLKKFSGKGVKITIETDEEVEAWVELSGIEPPMIYQAIGMTRENYTRERLKRQKKKL